MKQYKVGVIRVITSTDPEYLNMHGKLLESYFPMFTTVSRCIPDQPEGIHDEETSKMARPKIVELAKKMYEEDKVEAIIVSCAEDPAVAECREVLPIPIIGAGSSTATLAMYYGVHPAALGITEEMPAVYGRVFGDRCVDSRRGDKVNSTLDLLTPEGYQSTVEAALSEKEKGADVIALSCTGMATIKIAKPLQKDLGIPVVDPVMSEGLMTYFELLRREQ